MTFIAFQRDILSNNFIKIEKSTKSGKHGKKPCDMMNFQNDDSTATNERDKAA